MVRNAFMNVGAYALVISSPLVIAAGVYSFIKSVKFDELDFDFGTDDLESVSNGFDLR